MLQEINQAYKAHDYYDMKLKLKKAMWFMTEAQIKIGNKYLEKLEYKRTFLLDYAYELGMNK